MTHTLKDCAQEVYSQPLSGPVKDAGGGIAQEAIDKLKRGEKLGASANDIAEGVWCAMLRQIITDLTPKQECPCCKKSEIIIPAYGACMGCIASGCQESECRRGDLVDKNRR